MANLDPDGKMFKIEPDGDTIIPRTKSEGGSIQESPEREEVRYLVFSPHGERTRAIHGVEAGKIETFPYDSGARND
jgi:hypothetical protein